MFLNILRISASNVLEMFLNIFVGVQVLFSIRKNRSEAQEHLSVKLAATQASK